MSHLGKLVQVEWEDSFGCAVHWESLEGVKCEPAVAMTAGWVVAESERGLLVVPHRVQTIDDEQGCGDMVIPKRCILSIRELVVKPEVQP